MAEAPDLDRIKSNVAKMAEQNAPEADIDGYIASEGVSLDVVRDHPLPTQATPEAPAPLGKTVLDQGMQGATFGVADELTSAMAAPFVSAASNDGIMDKIKGIPDAYRAGQELSKQELSKETTDHPYVSMGANVAGGLLTGGAGASTKTGAAIANSVRTGLVPGSSLAARAANLFSKVGQGAAVGAASGGAYGAGTANEGERLDAAKSGALTGAAIGAALPLAGAAGSGAIGAIAPKADEGLRAVGELAQKFDIPVSVDQLTNSKAIKNVQKVSQELPFSGQAAFRDKQLRQWQRGVTKTFGMESDKITPEIMDKAFSKVGAEFDALGKGKTFDMAGPFKGYVDEILQDAPATYNADALKNFDKALESVSKNIADDGTITGEKLGFLRSKMNQMARKSSNPDTKELLHDLENAIIDTMTAGDDAAKQALSDAKYKYKNLLAVEPLAAKAKGGNISPALLANRVAKIYGREFTRGKAGDLGDLARIGAELLPELGGSDTTQKMLYAGGSLVGLANPLTTAKTAAALTANRGYQALVNRNPAMVNKMLQKAEKKALPAPGKQSRITPKMTEDTNNK